MIFILVYHILLLKEGDPVNPVRSATENTIPIPKILQRPDEDCLPDQTNESRLMALAAERISHYNPATVIPQKQVDQEFGFQSSDYENIEEIEFE